MFLQIVLAICFISSIHGEKLHDYMTTDEIRSVFRVHHDAVKDLDYQVVKIIHVDPRNNSEGRRSRARTSRPNLHFQVFNKNYSLYLEENDNVLLGSGTPVFIAKANPRKRSAYSDGAKIFYSRIQYPLPASFRLYHDVENKAAVSLHHENDDRFHVNGVIGDDIIRELPKRIHDEVLTKFSTRSKRSSLFDDDSLFNSDPFADPNTIFGDNTYKTTHHVIIRPNPNDNRHVFGSLDSRWSEIKTYNSTRQYVTWRPANLPFTRRTTTKAPYSRLATVPWYLQSVNDPAFWFHPTTKKPFTGYYTLPPRRPTFESRWQSYTRYPTRVPAPLPTRRRITVLPPNRFPTIGLPTTTSARPEPSKRSDTVYPQLLVTIDYDTFKAHGSDVEEVSKYMAAFFNAVDLRYRDMNSPNVRLNVAGLIIPTQPNSAEYMEEHKVSADSALAGETLTALGTYFSKNLKEFPKDMYDIVVGITHKDLGQYGKDGKFSGQITGIAHFKGVCKLEYGFADALVRDKGGFNGITTAAHEIAHSLGAPHDGPESAAVTGGPCAWDDGYLMSYNRKDKKGMHFSRCSIQAMREHFRRPEAQCLKNKPNTGSPYPKLLPGKLLSRDEQCRRSMGDNWMSYKDRQDNCATLWCMTTTKDNIMTHYRPPAEGTYCGEGAVCLNAECVKDPELSQ